MPTDPPQPNKSLALPSSGEEDNHSAPDNDFEASFQPETHDPLQEFDTQELDQMLSHTSGPQVFRAITHYYYQRELTHNGAQELPPIRAGAILTPAEYPLKFDKPKPVLHACHQRFFDLELFPEPLDAGNEDIEWIELCRHDTELLERDELDPSSIFST